MKIALAEAELRSCQEVTDRTRHQDVSRGSHGGYSCRDVHCDTFNASSDDFALSGMDANPKVDPDAPSSPSNVGRKLNRAAGAIESQEEPITGRINLASAKCPQMSADQFVMTEQQRAPSSVADSLQSLGRRDDVGEHQR